MYEDCAPQEEQVEKAVDCTASNGVRVQEGWRCTHKCINRLEGIIGRKGKKKRKKKHIFKIDFSYQCQPSHAL